MTIEQALEILSNEARKSLCEKYGDIDKALGEIEKAELAGAKIFAIRFMSRKQLISHYNKIEKRYKKNFTPYVYRKTKWRRIKIPITIRNGQKPKNWKDIIWYAKNIQKTQKQ